MAFQTNFIFKDKDLEDVIVALLILMSLKSFEFIVKSLLTSTRNKMMNTSRYALEIAVDEAFNPLNYWRWYLGCSDFESQNPSLKEREKRRPIPLARAFLAILVALMVILGDYTMFFFTQDNELTLYHTTFQLTVNSSTKHAKVFEIEKDMCTPKTVDTGRANMTAIFAFCNSIKGTAFRIAGPTALNFSHDEYSQSVAIFDDTNRIVSRTKFTILVPNHKVHLVVRYNATQQLVRNAAKEIIAYLKQGGCEVSGGRNGLYQLDNCTTTWTPDITVLMTTVLQYTEVDTKNRERGDVITVGHEAGDKIAEERTKLAVGVIQRKKMTALGVFIVWAALFTGALGVHLFIQNDSTAVIAAILRKETGQDICVPAVSMGSRCVQIEFDEDDIENGRSSYRLSHSIS